MVADTIRNEYYYDESAGIRQCLIKVLGIANKRLTHQRDRYGLGHQGEAVGPIGVAVAVVRGRELYVATVGPAEAYLIRQARLSTLPDPNGERGLPAMELEPEVWRGELNVGDSLRPRGRQRRRAGSAPTPSRTRSSRSTRSRRSSTCTPGSSRRTARAATAPSPSRRPRSARRTRPSPWSPSAPPSRSPARRIAGRSRSPTRRSGRRRRSAPARRRRATRPAAAWSGPCGGSRTCSRGAGRRSARSPRSPAAWRPSAGPPSRCSRSSRSRAPSSSGSTRWAASTGCRARRSAR